MKIAFYAPMKAPTDPVPSGDREIARLLLRALGEAGHEVLLASAFRSWEGHGDGERQRRLRDLGQRLADRLLRRFLAQPVDKRPQLWFTYHLYYKAPDWLGPRVSEALGIPYVAAEASYAPKRAHGPWALGLDAARAAISQSDVVIALKSYDIPCLLPLLDDPRRLRTIKPFLDTRDYLIGADQRTARRNRLAHRFDLDTTLPWLLTVAMMRPGNKLRCYRVLARALQRVSDRRLCLLVVGDGPARGEVEAAFGVATHHRIVFAGLQSPRALQDFYAAADLFVWPAVDEPFGMALLEAQAAGLAVVAGRSRGVPDVVVDQLSGVLVAPDDAAAFAQAITTLCNNPRRRCEMGAAARHRAQQEHDIRAAGAALDRILRQARERATP